MKPAILILISVLFLSGCSQFNREPEVVTRTVIAPVEIFPPARPAAVETVAVDWQVLPPNTTTRTAIIGLSPTDYESMILFNFDVMRYIRQLQALVTYYERSIEQHNTRITEKNNDTDPAEK